MIIIATGIEEFNQQLKEKIDSENIGETKIIGYREYLMDEKVTPDIVIISRRLPGDTSEKNLLFSLKKRKARIIYITDKEDIDGILYCFDLASYDFLFDPVSADDVINCLKNPNSFTDVSSIYLSFRQRNGGKRSEADGLDELGAKLKKNILPEKGEVREKEKIREVEKIKVVEKKVIETRLYKQNVISFYSADNNILSSIVLVNSAVEFSKKADRKILIIDADAVPCMDQLLNVSKEINVKDVFNTAAIDTGISACYSSIENGTFTPALLQKFVVPSKNKNIHVLTGLYQDNLLEEMEINHYKKIIETAKELYDVILISVNPFKSNVGTIASILASDKVVAVVESNYLSARNTFNSLKTFEDAGANKNKFGIAVFERPGSLDYGIMEKIFEGYKIVSEVPYNKNYNKTINLKKPLIGSLFAVKSDRTAYSKLINFMGFSSSVLIQESKDTDKEDEDKADTDKTDKKVKKHFEFPSLKKIIGRR